jgi:hypothetical protein
MEGTEDAPNPRGGIRPFKSRSLFLSFLILSKDLYPGVELMAQGNY